VWPLLTGCVTSSGEVVRVVDGRELPGRYVSDQTYSAYARGALLEAQGDLRGAAHAYGQALEEDPPNAPIWTRLGALRCQLGQNDAAQAFARAAQIDATYAPVYRELARCHARHGKLDAALEAAQHAFELDPDEEQTSLLLASINQRLGRPQQAERWLEGLVAREPDSLPGWNALYGLSVELRDPVKRRRAAAKMAELGAATTRELGAELERVKLFELDRAIQAGDIAKARGLAIDLSMSSGELALRAAAQKNSRLVREQAEWILVSDPNNGDAWVALLIAADLDADRVAFDRALAGLRKTGVEPGPTGFGLLGELIGRRIGPDASEALTRALGSVPSERALSR
jgi:hypothetical protein